MAHLVADEGKEWGPAAGYVGSAHPPRAGAASSTCEPPDRPGPDGWPPSLPTVGARCASGRPGVRADVAGGRTLTGPARVRPPPRGTAVETAERALGAVVHGIPPDRSAPSVRHRAVPARRPMSPSIGANGPSSHGLLGLDGLVRPPDREDRPHRAAAVGAPGRAASGHRPPAPDHGSGAGRSGHAVTVGQANVENGHPRSQRGDADQRLPHRSGLTDHAARPWGRRRDEAGCTGSATSKPAGLSDGMGDGKSGPALGAGPATRTALTQPSASITAVT